MADPLSISASIVALLQLSAVVVKYLSDVKNGPEDCVRLRGEVSGLVGLLSTFQLLAQPGDAWLATFQSLDRADGPLKQFEALLKRLEKKLAPVTGAKKVKFLIWPFQSDDIKDMIVSIEHLKTLFLLALQNDHLGLSRAIKGHVDEVKEDLQQVIQIQKDQQSLQIIASLSSLNFSTKQNDFFGRRQQGTGKWMLENEKFKRWIDGADKVLWCPGLPGAGKTILTSIVVDYLERAFVNQNVAVGYVYCSYKERDSQTDINLIASLLQQLVRDSATISKEVTELYKNHMKKDKRPPLAELTNVLRNEICRFSKVFILIDALDECADNNGTRASFLGQIQTFHPHIHLLVTSRDNMTIAREFEKAQRLEIRANDGDIRTYLDSRTAKEPLLRRYTEKNPGLQDTIIEKAKGMFLLAQLHMDALANKDNIKAVRKALAGLPPELDDTYDEAMRRIKCQNVDKIKRAEQVLSWISYAVRPLRVEEVQHALAIEPGDTEFDEDSLPDEGVLLSVCAGLVTIDQESSIIRLVHYTAQEYFERSRGDLFPHAQANIARSCLTYISLHEGLQLDKDGTYDSEIDTIRATARERPLLVYAVEHWGDHARGDVVEEEIEEDILQFLDAETMMAWFSKLYYAFRWVLEHPVTGLHVAALFGLTRISHILLTRGGADLNLRDADGHTPLYYAAGRGREEVARLLLGHKDVDVNSRGSGGRSPLIFAASDGHEAVVRLLLGHKDIDVNSRDSGDWTALMVAAQDGREAVVRLLLGHKDVDVNFRSSRGGTALMFAARDGHEAVVRLLLGHKDIDVNSRDSDGWTALMVAAQDGQEAVVRLLLGHKDVDVNFRSSRGGTAFMFAAQDGQEAVVRLLLGHKDIDVNSRDSDGWTALIVAAQDGHEAVVRLLLGHKDIDVNSKESLGKTSLIWAVQQGHEAIVQLLLETAALTDIEGSEEASAAHMAVQHGGVSLVRLLIEKGAKRTDSQGISLLHWASSCGNLEVYEYLKDLGMNSMIPDTQGRFLLHHAASSGSLDMVDRVLYDGANINVVDRDGWTPLHWASRTAARDVVEKLLSAGANPVAQSLQQWTPLDVATLHGQKSVVSTLKAAAAESDRELSTQTLVAGIVGWAGCTCDGCGLDICGTRYKCEDCTDFDFCYKCFWTAAETHPSHRFKELLPEEKFRSGAVMDSESGKEEYNPSSDAY